MLETVHSLIKRVGRKAGLDEGEIAELLKFDAEHQFDIKLSSGKSFKAFRVQHNDRRGPYKGGIRFHPSVDLDESRALATLMSLKTAAVGLPLGGGKGGVAVNPKELSATELEELSRKYASHLARHIGPDKDVPAPDVNTSSKLIDWMVDEYEKITGDASGASFTGKSLGRGGSYGRDAATGRGGVFALRELLKLEGKADQPLRLAVQGFGNVGSFFGLVAAEDCPQWRLVAASDSSATLVNQSGLDALEVDKFKKAGNSFVDFKAADTKILPSDKLVETKVDVLILAALGNSLTEQNVGEVKAKYVVELANGPMDEPAQEQLTADGVVVLPDIIANSGGVIVSYLEWLQNKKDESWRESKVNRQLKNYITKAVKETYSLAKKKKISLKEAAFMLALNRLNSKHKGGAK